VIEIRSSGAGAPVVFLHGCPTPHDLFDDLARHVATRHRALVVSLPGYGASPALPASWTLEALHDALARAIDDAAAGERPWLVGFSGGAYHALAIAAQVRAAGVFSLAGLLDLTDEERAGQRSFADAVAAGVDLRPLAGPRFLSDAYRAAHPESAGRVARWLDATSSENLAAELRVITTMPDLTPRVAALDVPVIARVGTLDVVTPPAKSEAIVRTARHGTLQLVDGSGHALPYEDARGTADAVLAAVTA
jgi:3-oxoadipate enol-lactonase